MLREAVWRMWHGLRNFNQHLNDVLGEALFECFFLELLHCHGLRTSTIFFHGAFLEARLVEKLGSAQLLSTLGSSGVQSTWSVARVPLSPS